MNLLAPAYGILLNTAIVLALATDSLEDFLWPFALMAALGAGAAVRRPGTVARIIAITASGWLLGAFALLREEALGYGLFFIGLIAAMQIAGLVAGSFTFGIRATAPRPTRRSA